MADKLPDASERAERYGIDRRVWRVAMLILFTVLAVTGCLMSIALGAADISVSQVAEILLHPKATPQDQIIWNIRLPRTIVGAMVGLNLSLSGAILQAVMRNPLADPHIIGISSGAGIAGITIMILFPALEYLITPVAFIGAMLAAIAIYILAWKNGIKPVRMWMVGGLAARSWPHVTIIVPYALIGLVLAIISAHYLNILQLGDEMAKGLGVNVEVTRIALTAIAALLAASAVSVAGLLGFVGLVIPHVSRLILGSDYRFLIPGAALLGIAIITFSDTFARVAFAPIELPVGIIMAFIGAPFFLFLLRREL